MANTYTQIHIHAVFAVQNRMSLIQTIWREDLYKYITGIVQNHGHKVLAIGGTVDHIHLLFGMRPNQALSELMKAVKGDSSHWINENRFVQGRFSWQEGFAAFSYSKSQLDIVINYIGKQEEHYHKQTFLEEYQVFLKKFEVEFDERYLFKSIS